MKPSPQKSVEWFTPDWVFNGDAVGYGLGLHFDLDPCSPADATTHVPATLRYTRRDDGLAQPWCGRVWLNPPYTRDVGHWMRKWLAHGNGIAMVFCRSDAAWCQACLSESDAVLFLAGRIDFVPGPENRGKESRAGAATVMFALGADNANALERLSTGRGVFIRRGKIVSSRVPFQVPLLSVA